EVEGAVTSPINEPLASNKHYSDAQLEEVSEQSTALLLSQMSFRNEYPVLWKARNTLLNMTFYPGFDITRFSLLRTKAAEIRPITHLIPNGANLGTVLHEIFNRLNFKGAAENLREYLRTAFPTIEDIWCETTYGAPPQILVRFKEKRAVRQTEIWEMSDGMLRFLCLAVALLNPVPAPLIVIDEPELGLHPKLLPIVSDMIKESAAHTQVLITTHSPDLLDCFDINDTAVMARAQDELKTTWHRPSSRKGLVQLLNSTTEDSLGDMHRSGELEAGA
ncbi:MAG: AAA family ATPase, partial [Gammaproteobacteria bacterium]|nr:AAA family ATPase [Gammaproteobacteria bacterium]